MFNTEDLDDFDKKEIQMKLIKTILICLWHCITLKLSITAFLEFIQCGGDSDLLFKVFLYICINPVSIKTAIKIFCAVATLANFMINDLLALFIYFLAFIIAVVFGGIAGLPAIIADLVRRVAELPSLVNGMKDGNLT